MMKNRSFLLGLGSGLIAGALLLQLMISGGAAPRTKDQVIKDAARLGLAVTDQAAQPSATDPAEGAPQPTGDKSAPAKPSEPAAAVAPSPAASPAAAAEPNAAATPQQPAAPSQPVSTATQLPKVTTVPASSPAAVPASPKVPANGNLSVRIPNGSTLTETANILAGAGVIKDKQQFLKAAKERKINTIIQYGAYSFEKNESITSIIAKLIAVR